MIDACRSRQLLDLLQFYVGFEINEHTGAALSKDEMLARHYNRIQLLQRHCFKAFPEEMREFALANIGAVETRDSLQQHLAKLSKTQELEILRKVRVVPEDDDPNVEVGGRVLVRPPARLERSHNLLPCSVFGMLKVLLYVQHRCPRNIQCSCRSTSRIFCFSSVFLFG